MNTRLLSLAAALSLSLGGAALAQTAQENLAGHWLYDLQGNTIGSVRAFTDDGRTAQIMIGSYFQPGNHTETVPAGALSVVDGKLVLRPATMQAFNRTVGR